MMGDTGVNIPESGDFADLYAQGPPTAASQEQEVIGGFYGGPDIYLNPQAQPGPDGIPYRPGEVPNPYFAGVEYSILRGLTLENRTRLQQQLAGLGLASDPVYGEIDDNTVRGFKHVLAMANRRGDTWEATLGRIATEGAQAGGLGPDGFEPEPYLAPDYATVAQRVKSTFRDQLGRDPDDYELQQLAGELSGFDALAHEREQEFAELAATGGAGEQVSRVDPLARFNERFEDLYAGELDFLDDKQRAAETRGKVQGAVDMISRAAQGG